MAFPRRLLVDSEELILELRPHPVALVRAVLVTLAVVVGWIFLFNKVVDLSGILGKVTFLGGLVILGLWPVRDTVRFLSSYFVVTSDRVIHRQGWIAKQSMEIPLEAINDVRFNQNVFERMINSGDIMISSASTHGTGTFSDIRNPEEVQKTIYHQGELNQQRMMSGGRSAAAAASGSIADELAKLDKLRADGVISEEEFQSQKTKLLGG
ncbi:MAG: PH domain-containing protein [Actinobacteria bacterium]|nr:PH domain-containing protein [Actinomycetota bacterium]